MKHISQIEPVATLAQIDQAGLAAVTTAAAKIFLSGDCFCRRGNRFHLSVLLIIGQRLLESPIIADREQICRHCRWRQTCQARQN